MGRYGDGHTRQRAKLVNELVPFAASIGQQQLAEYASRRASWLLITYRDRKEYCFQGISRWFLKAAEIDVSIWSTIGWHLWEICRICRDKDGSNEYGPDLLNGIGAASSSQFAG